jgi:hypothetical protein
MPWLSHLPRKGSPFGADPSAAGLIGGTKVSALTAVVVVIPEIHTIITALRVPRFAGTRSLLAGHTDTRAHSTARTAVEIVTLQVNAAERAVGMPLQAAREDTLVGDRQVPVLVGYVRTDGTACTSGSQDKEGGDQDDTCRGLEKFHVHGLPVPFISGKDEKRIEPVTGRMYRTIT